MRLDRSQKVVTEGQDDTGSALFSLTSRLLLGVPAVYVQKLDATWSDKLVYVHVWRDFLTSAQDEWRQHLTWVRPCTAHARSNRCLIPPSSPSQQSLGMSMSVLLPPYLRPACTDLVFHSINLLFLVVPEASSEIAGLSLLCCAIASIAALGLLTYHHTTCVRSPDHAVRPHFISFSPISDLMFHPPTSLTHITGPIPRSL